jgi:hypothetical protein
MEMLVCAGGEGLKSRRSGMPPTAFHSCRSSRSSSLHQVLSLDRSFHLTTPSSRNCASFFPLPTALMLCAPPWITQALREAEADVPRWLDGLLLTARAAKPIG